jgi:hypothetical protein
LSDVAGAEQNDFHGLSPRGESIETSLEAADVETACHLRQKYNFGRQIDYDR